MAPDQRGRSPALLRRLLGEVAARVGYDSEFTFAHGFKRAYGPTSGRNRRG
ncbi:hypothetical protein [Herbidospora sp. RD11066]